MTIGALVCLVALLLFTISSVSDTALRGGRRIPLRDAATAGCTAYALVAGAVALFFLFAYIINRLR